MAAALMCVRGPAETAQIRHLFCVTTQIGVGGVRVAQGAVRRWRASI
jgi:hypothetical protein